MRKVLIVTTAAILLTGGCSPSYRCQRDYGLSKGTADFSNCMVHEEEVNLRRSAILSQVGDQLLQMSRPPVYAPIAPPTINYPTILQTHYCQGSNNGNGSFTATCN